MNWMLHGALVVLTLAAAITGCGGGGSDDSAPMAATPTGPGYSDPAGAAVTSHTLNLGGRSIAYAATAGHLTAIDLASGTPQASMFYGAYAADGVAAATRPIVFFYNGGPGSATVWLHLGSFGPRRIVPNAP